MEAAVKFGFGPSPFCSAKNLTQDERERERDREREREKKKKKKKKKIKNMKK
jgi:hypothetical protein